MKFLRSLVLLLVLCQGAYAESVSPYRATVSKRTSRQAAALQGSTTHNELVERIPAIFFSTQLHTEGRAVVRLFLKKNVTWKARTAKEGRHEDDSQRLELYQGEVIIRGIHYPAAASVEGDKIVLSFPGRERGSRGSRQRLFTVTAPQIAKGSAQARVASAPAAIFRGKTCLQESGHAATDEHPHTIAPLSVSAEATRVYRVLTLSTVADPELYARYGANTNAHVAGIINAAEALFDRQLGIRFKIVKQAAFADRASLNLPQLDPGELLKAFANNPDNSQLMGISAATFDQDVDIKHLFTGKDLNGTTVGIAYVGAVCYSPQFAYGLTEASSRSAAPYYFAHEVGHNLGARHDPAPWGAMSIMSPSIIVGSTFSKLSIDQINEHLRYFPGCAELQAIGINLSSATLTIGISRSRNTVKIRGRLVSLNREAITGAPVRLKIGSRSVVLKTDQYGYYSYVVRSRARRSKTIIFASTTGGEVRSRSIMVMGL